MLDSQEVTQEGEVESGVGTDVPLAANAPVQLCEADLDDIIDGVLAGLASRFAAALAVCAIQRGRHPGRHPRDLQRAYKGYHAF